MVLNVLLIQTYSLKYLIFPIWHVIPTTHILDPCISGFHRRDNDQVHAVRDEYLHREPGPCRHPGHAILRPALHHLGRDQHLDLRIAHVQDRHLHPGI